MLCWQRYASVASASRKVMRSGTPHSQPVQLTKQRCHVVVFSSTIKMSRAAAFSTDCSLSSRLAGSQCQCGTAIVEFGQDEWRDQCLQSRSWHRPSDAPDLPQHRKATWRSLYNVPGCQACNRKRPTTELGATVTWHDELMATCRAEPLKTGNISRRLAAVHKVLRSIALQTPTNSHSELELDRPTLRYIHPMELGVPEWSRCVKPRSNLWVPLTTRAAAFGTRWRRSVLAFDDAASTVLQPSTRVKKAYRYANVFADSVSSESDEARKSTMNLCLKPAMTVVRRWSLGG